MIKTHSDLDEWERRMRLKEYILIKKKAMVGFVKKEVCEEKRNSRSR